MYLDPPSTQMGIVPNEYFYILLHFIMGYLEGLARSG
jgi:hypothetical protein